MRMSTCGRLFKNGSTPAGNMERERGRVNPLTNGTHRKRNKAQQKKVRKEQNKLAAITLHRQTVGPKQRTKRPANKAVTAAPIHRMHRGKGKENSRPTHHQDPSTTERQVIPDLKICRACVRRTRRGKARRKAREGERAGSLRRRTAPSYN